MEKYRIINMKHDKRKTMTTIEFAKEYGIGINSAYNIVHTKGFPAISLGRKKLIIRSKVDEWIEQHIGESF